MNCHRIVVAPTPRRNDYLIIEELPKYRDA